MKNLLVVIDYQNVALSYDPKKYSEELRYTSAAIQKTASIVDALNGQDDNSILWVAYAPSRDDVFGNGISGWHPDLLKRIKPKDTLFVKQTKSAFGAENIDGEMNFQDVLTEAHDSIFIVGTSVIDCLKKTIEDAVKIGLENKIVLPRDACSPSPAFTTNQDNYLSNLSKLTVCSTERLIEYIKDGTPLQHLPFKKSVCAIENCREDNDSSIRATTPPSNYLTLGN